MSEFDVNGYNSHECDIHNHGYYLGAQSQQAKIDELQSRVDEALNMLCKLQYSSGERIYNDVGNILKGNTNDH